MITLDEHLANAMAERKGFGKKGSFQSLKRALVDFPGMKEQAAIRLKYYESADGQSVLQRDHVSRMHNIILKEALT